MVDLRTEEFDRLAAIDKFKEIVEEIEATGEMIPSINRITTYNEKEVIINFYDKFFSIFEVLSFETGEDEDKETTNQLAAVALGRHEDKGGILLIDFRFIGPEETDLFRRGVEAFMDMIDRNKIEELPATELHAGGKLDYDDIIQSIAQTYKSIEPKTVH